MCIHANAGDDDTCRVFEHEDADRCVLGGDYRGQMSDRPGSLFAAIHPIQTPTPKR